MTTLKIPLLNLYIYDLNFFFHSSSAEMNPFLKKRVQNENNDDDSDTESITNSTDERGPSDDVVDQMIECIRCNKTFSNKAKLQVHMFKKHTMVKVCETCNIMVVGEMQWKRHEDKHKREQMILKKFHFCEFCNKQFTMIGARDTHVKSKHCVKCHKFFARVPDLIAHTFSQHENVSFSCGKCHPVKMFETECEAQDHERHEHKCDHCYRNFCNFVTKTNHMLRCHPTPTTPPAARATPREIQPSPDDHDTKAEWRTVKLHDGFHYLVNIAEGNISSSHFSFTC